MQTGWQIIGKAVTSLSTIIILSLISRNFGEAGTGVFTLALAYLTFFALAVDGGINAHLLPRLLKSEATYEWRRLFGLRLSLSFILILLALATALFWPIQELLFKRLVFIGATGAILGPAFFVTANAVFQSRLRYDLSVLAASVGSLLTLFFIVMAVRSGFALPNLMAGYVLGWLAMAALSLVLAQKYISNLRPIFNINYIKSIFKEAWPISAALVINVIYFRADTFILSAFRPLSEVGIYNLAYQVFQSALVLPTFIMNGYYPLMLRNLGANQGSFFISLKRALLIMFILAIMGTGAAFVLAGMIVGVLTGGVGFDGSSETLKILSFGFPAFFLSSVLMWTLVALKKYRLVVVIYGAGLIVNIALNLWLIPRYSYLAAAWVTGITEYLILVLQMIILYQYFKRSV